MAEQRGLSEFRVEGVKVTAAVLLLTGDSGALVRPLFLLCGGVNIPIDTNGGLGGALLNSAKRLWADSYDLIR